MRRLLPGAVRAGPADGSRACAPLHGRNIAPRLSSDTGQEKSMATDPMTPFNVLFLCTGNSARSILAEAILNSRRARAGSAPTAPAASRRARSTRSRSSCCASRSIPTDGLRSKSWDEFAQPGAPRAGLRVHRLRQRGGRSLPVLAGPADDRALGRPGSGRRARVGRGRSGRRSATRSSLLRSRIELFASLPIDKLSRLALQERAPRHRRRVATRPVDLTRRGRRRGARHGLLLAAVVGSGIMGERLAGGNVAMALLANSLATGGALLALISMLRPDLRRALQPGGHASSRGGGRAAVARRAGRTSPRRWPARCSGVLAAHLMFGEPGALAIRTTAAARRRPWSAKPSPRSACWR